MPTLTKTPLPPGARGHSRTPLLLTLALMLPVLASGGCNKFAVTTPDDFVSLKRWRTTTRYKAVSPDNAVISIRSFEHHDKGSLGFWTEILRREMTLRKGYKLTASAEVKTERGDVGHRLVFAARSGKSQYTYAAAVFVTKRWIHVIETAARAKIYRERNDAFDRAIASFRPR